MKQHSDLIQSAPSAVASRLCRHPWMAALPAILVALPGLGCFRATGIQRPDVVAEEISPVGGDRVKGLKAQGAPGDFYLGNDYLEVAVDGTPFGERGGVAGAAGGGSIIDAGEIALDQNYKRVSIPGDALDRLTPVLNQDPSISLVFERYKPINLDTEASLEMEGFVHDPAHKLIGATWDSQNRVAGVRVSHVISLGKMDRYFTLKTTVTNQSSTALPITNIGDFLFQEAGVLRFNVPASENMAGSPLPNSADDPAHAWGVEIPDSGPGSSASFGNPGQGVKALMVGFMGVEPTGTTEDSHTTLGILPLDSDHLVISSDPQKALDQTRPVFPKRLVAGSIPGASLAPGASISHSRRLYVSGGSSASVMLGNQASNLFNEMSKARYSLKTAEYGAFLFQPAGTAIRQGPYPSEFRIERNVGGLWKLERLEWLEPFENTPDSADTGSPRVLAYLPTGTYRLMVRNAFGNATFPNLVNTSSEDRADLPGPLLIESKKIFSSNPSVDFLCPEKASVLGASGSVIASKADVHSFLSRTIDGSSNSLQPLRIGVFGLGSTPDPSLKRTKTLATLFSPIYSSPVISSQSNYGVFGFTAGNELFAASIPNRVPTYFWLAPGEYQALAARGPLSFLETRSITAFNGQANSAHSFTILNAPLPLGWTSFDLPGPSLATTGGLLPVEKLSSAMAEGVQVVGMTEKDRLVDSQSVVNHFRGEFLLGTISDADRTAIGSDPFVIEARSSDLGGYGSVTALFTPSPRNERNGGARNSSGWTLADFLTQAEGQYNVIHRPRGPQGLFTVKGFNRGEALSTGSNLWWSATTALSSGKTQGGFDALELLRGEASDASGQPLSLQVPANATAWFNEFLEVRADWFALLKQQPSTSFTKGLGLSSTKYSLDTPVGLARTYLKATGFTQSNTTPILQALQSGAAVASTGPMLDVTLAAPAGTTAFGPGALVPGPQATVTLTVNLWAPDWVPVDELRVVINGTPQVLDINQLQPLLSTDAAYDKRLRRGTFTLTLPGGKDAWVVVEAGVPLGTTGAYRVGTPWHKLMKGIYPIAVTNPIFVDVTGGGYTPPGL